MHVGLGLLRLSPDAFWAMTPREFLAATGWHKHNRATGGLDRKALDRLMCVFPDRAPETLR
ncbi:MAG: rcc01693 family protein [Pseudomonadota bacterium]